jgi:hypothetical protein
LSTLRAAMVATTFNTDPAMIANLPKDKPETLI